MVLTLGYRMAGRCSVKHQVTKRALSPRARDSHVPVIATLLAGFACCAVYADEMLPRGGTLHAFVALLQKWSVWPGPPNHAWNRWAPKAIASLDCQPMHVAVRNACRYMQFLLAALLLGLDLRKQAPVAPVSQSHCLV